VPPRVIHRRCVAAAGFLPFAGDLSLLFPVDVRNAAIYSKAADAMENGKLSEAEDLLGAAGLWVCAAEIYRVLRRTDDFARIARSHAPHLLKAAAATGSVGLRSQQPQPSPAPDQDAALSGASEPERSSDRVAFPAPPPPTRRFLRARFFIPGLISLFSPRPHSDCFRSAALCIAACCCLWIALLGFAAKLPCVDCPIPPSPPDSVMWGVPVTLALNLWVMLCFVSLYISVASPHVHIISPHFTHLQILSSSLLAWVVHERRS
jgi:hypothetical protein